MCALEPRQNKKKMLLSAKFRLNRGHPGSSDSSGSTGFGRFWPVQEAKRFWMSSGSLPLPGPGGTGRTGRSGPVLLTLPTTTWGSWWLVCHTHGCKQLWGPHVTCEAKQLSVPLQCIFFWVIYGNTSFCDVLVKQMQRFDQAPIKNVNLNVGWACLGLGLDFCNKFFLKKKSI